MSENQRDPYEQLRRVLDDNDLVTYHFFENRAVYQEDKNFFIMVDDRWEDEEFPSLEEERKQAQELDEEDANEEEEQRKENEAILSVLRSKYNILHEYDERVFHFSLRDPVLHNVLSAAVIKMKLGEGILDFIYADFNTPLKKSFQVAQRFRMFRELHRKEHPQQQRVPVEETADETSPELEEYYRYLDTFSYVSDALYQALYTTICPPVFATDDEPERMILMVGRYLMTLQMFYREVLDFCFNPELFPETMGTLPPHERYSLFLSIKGYHHAHERIEHFILSQTRRGGTTVPYGLPFKEMNDRVMHFQPTDAQRREMEEFQEKYHTDIDYLELHLRFPTFVNIQYGFSSVEEALELEFTKALEAGVTFRKCKRCGKYFIMKGNYDTNYCDRVAEGATRTCQELAAQENYQKKMADNAAMPLYNKYYKRYAARVKVRQIKEADFKRWKYEALSKRDACTDGQITLEEYEAWLEGSFPNRKKKEVTL